MAKTNVAAALFLLGSVVFTIDGIMYLSETISSHAILYTTGSLSFAIGSALMFDVKK